MATTKQPKGKIKFEESPVDTNEREERRAELRKKYPDGYVWLIPICDYKEMVSMQNPRREDHYKPRVTVIKIPKSIHRGTHSATGLPKYDEKLISIMLIDPDLHWPVDVRSDLVRGLDKSAIDPWELLDYLDSFPGREGLFRMQNPDPIIDDRIQKGLRAKGARAALHDVMGGKAAKTRPSDVAPTVKERTRRTEGVSMDEGLSDDEAPVGALAETEA